MDCNNESSKLNSNAVQKVATENPPMKLSASIIINAFITNRKRPNVKTVIGSVRITKIGLITAFSSANTMATISAAIKPETSTLGKK